MSDDAKSTPGPWTYEDCFHPEFIIRAKGLGVIARSIYPDGNGIGRANARLIAAAPELLDALRGFLDCIGTRKPDVDGYYSEPIHRDEVERARAAIAKAEGR